MILIGYDNQGTGAPVTAIYELDGQTVSIPANTAPENVEAAVIAALAALPFPKPARQQLNDYLTNHQDLLVYASYFFRLQKALLTLWKTKPNLLDTTTAVYAALRANKDTDAQDAVMYNTFLWYVQRTTNTVLVSGDLPASPTAAQAQVINQAAYLFMTAGMEAMNLLLRG